MRNITIGADLVTEHLPFPDLSFDASVATFTVHQWLYLAEGVRELSRLTRGPIGS